MRIEVYEKYCTEEPPDPDWWQNVMGHKTPLPEPEYSYRRTMIEVALIERPIEIPGNKKELILRMWTGEDMTIKDNYDSFCTLLHDYEELEGLEDAP